jgi:hypothetical protein
MKGVPVVLDGRRKLRFSTVTRGRFLRYPRARFLHAKEWELELIMQAEEEFGAIRVVSKMLAEAGKRLAFAKNAIGREGRVSSRRLGEVVKQAQKACEAADKMKKENLDIEGKSVDLTQAESSAEPCPRGVSEAMSAER